SWTAGTSPPRGLFFLPDRVPTRSLHFPPHSGNGPGPSPGRHCAAVSRTVSMGRKPASYPGTLVVPTQRLRLRRPSAPVLLGGVCLVLVGALCAYLRLGLVLSALVEIVTFGAMREARLRRALLEARAARNELRLAIDTIPTIVW